MYVICLILNISQYIILFKWTSSFATAYNLKFVAFKPGFDRRLVLLQANPDLFNRVLNNDSNTGAIEDCNILCQTPSRSREEI